MNYPNGKKKTVIIKGQEKQSNYSNRGMTLEEDINATNIYYRENNKAIIHKKPTPVQIVRVDYPKRSAAVIKEAYFKQASTTDFNGVYKGKYIDFEAKETKNKTSFPLSNFHDHQIEHMKAVVHQGGICFVIIRFAFHKETYYLDAVKLFEYWNRQYKNGRKSIPYQEVKDNGILIPFHFQARVDYLSVLDQL